MKSNPAKRPSRRRVVRARASSNGTRTVLPLFRFYYTFYDSPRPRFSTFCFAFRPIRVIQMIFNSGILLCIIDRVYIYGEM